MKQSEVSIDGGQSQDRITRIVMSTSNHFSISIYKNSVVIVTTYFLQLKFQLQMIDYNKNEGTIKKGYTQITKHLFFKMNMGVKLLS